MRDKYDELFDIEQEERRLSFDNIDGCRGDLQIVISRRYKTGAIVPEYEATHFHAEIVNAFGRRYRLTGTIKDNGKFEDYIYVDDLGYRGRVSSDKRRHDAITYQPTAIEIWEYYMSEEGTAAWKEEALKRYEAELEKLVGNISWVWRKMYEAGYAGLRRNIQLV